MEETINNTEMQQPQQPATQTTSQTIIVEHKEDKKNRIGTAGFIIALISLFVDFVPVLGWIVWFLGALFSFIGIFKKPRGLAVAGLILSFIGIIILVAVVGAIGLFA